MSSSHYSNIEKAVLEHLSRSESTELVLRIRENNQIIRHNFRVAQPRREVCSLEGCQQEFEYTLIPHQILYPRFCCDHRSDFRRRHFTATR
jgi:hypothetical protein